MLSVVSLGGREVGMHTLLRVVLATAVAFSTVACNQVSVGAAVAERDAFPDLSGYPLAEDVYGTENTRRYFSGDTFRTPDGQRCSINTRDYLHRLWCHGPRPDKGGYWDTSFGPETAATITPGDPPKAGGEPSQGFFELPSGHKINLQAGMVCAVGADPSVGLFACRAGGHGFVFTKTSTRVF
ncbi:hypothetical protein [Mycolicibacterium sp. HK-90]|uniref:hypothetical protein n=1 Tax=Mycolicibacterium sp. HK-90 TaxID=3056937 RepID=UPI0026596E3F|nr:hypothetical protein [Mycolicibacterium sp. HK-90]WKG01200.1 hypothetical protein QU592_18090 [Mycolicibacterium sp. HK-90]